MAAKSAGVIKHSLKAFQSVEQQIKNKQEYLDKEIGKMEEFIKEEADEIFGSTDQNRINLQLLDTKMIIVEHVDTISHQYELAGEPMIGEELPFLIPNINKRFDKYCVLPVELDVLIKTVKTKLYFNNDLLNMMIAIPIVSKDIFHRFFVTPIPSNDGSKVPDFQPQTVTVNFKELEFITVRDFVQINDTAVMTKEPVQVHERLNDGSNCVVRSILERASRCQLKPLPKTYDQWVDTGITNAVAFLSNVKKIMKCTNSSSEIKETAGIINLKESCAVITNNFVIKASPDKTNVEHHYFNIEVPPTNFPQPIYTPTHHKTLLSHDAPPPTINDEDLNDAIDEANDLQSIDIYKIIVITIISIAIVLIVCLCLIGRIKRYGRPKQDKQKDQQKDEQKDEQCLEPSFRD